MDAALLSSKLTIEVDDDAYFLHREIFSLLWIDNLHTKYLARLRRAGSRYFMGENEPNALRRGEQQHPRLNS